MPVKFQRETIGDCIAESIALAKMHHGEINGALRKHSFDPNFDMYLGAERVGLLRLFTMRNDGELVGYSIFTVLRHLYYDALFAKEEYLFVHPGFRGFSAGKFFLWTEQQVIDEGAEIIGREVSGVDYSRSLKKLGYVEAERGYIREI